MKVAYLVWEYEEDKYPILVPEHDDKIRWCHKSQRIVYFEVEE